MNKIIRTLGSISKDSNLNNRQKYIIGETLEHMQHLEQQSCKDCEHFKLNRSGCVSFKDCEFNFDCKVIRPNNFKKKVE